MTNKLQRDLTGSHLLLLTIGAQSVLPPVHYTLLYYPVKSAPRLTQRSMLVFLVKYMPFPLLAQVRSPQHIIPREVKGQVPHSFS